MAEQQEIVLGAKQLKNPKGIKPVLDSDVKPEPMRLPKGVKARPVPYKPAEGAGKMSIENAPLENPIIPGPIRSFEEGTNFVPETGPAILHQGEAVVPAKNNPSNPWSVVSEKPAPAQSSDPWSVVSEKPAPPPAEKPAEQPGFFERAYETSGLKGMVDKAKAEADERESVKNDIVSAVKAGKYGHAAETLLRHIAGGATSGNPGLEMIEGAGRGLATHVPAAIKAAKEGKTGEAVEHAAEALPVLGQVGETVGKPLGTDLGSGGGSTVGETLKNANLSGVAGDVVGGALPVLGTAKMGEMVTPEGSALNKPLGKSAPPPVPAAKTLTAEETAPKAQPLKVAGERVQQEAQAVRDVKGKAVGAAKEAAQASLPPRSAPIFLEKGNLGKAAQAVLKDTADEQQLAGAKDPDMSDVRAMADHLSKGQNAAGEPLDLDPEKVDSVKRAFDNKIEALKDKAAAGGNASALRHVKNLKNAYMDDVYDAYEKYGDPKAAQALRATSKEYAQTVGEQTSGPARSMLRNKSPEKIVSSIVEGGAKSQSAVESLMKNSSPEGQAVLRDSVLQEIYRKNTLPDGTIDMVKARKAVYGMGDTAKSLFGNKLQETTDFLDAAAKEQTKRAKPSMTKRIVPKITTAAGAGGGAAIGGVVPGGSIPGAIAGGVGGSELGEALIGRSGAVKIGISPTEKITLSPSQATANRPMITKFLKAKAAGNAAAMAAAYSSITGQKQKASPEKEGL